MMAHSWVLTQCSTSQHRKLWNLASTRTTNSRTCACLCGGGISAQTVPHSLQPAHQDQHCRRQATAAASAPATWCHVRPLAEHVLLTWLAWMILSTQQPLALCMLTLLTQVAGCTEAARDSMSAQTATSTTTQDLEAGVSPCHRHTPASSPSSHNSTASGSMLLRRSGKDCCHPCPLLAQCLAHMSAQQQSALPLSACRSGAPQQFRTWTAPTLFLASTSPVVPSMAACRRCNASWTSTE